VMDVQMEMIAYMFGQKVPQTPNVFEVVCLMVPPQFGSLYDCQTPDKIPFDTAEIRGNNLELIGVVRCGGGTPVLHTKDVALHGRLIVANEGLQLVTPDNSSSEIEAPVLVTTVVGLADGALTLENFGITESGLRWGKENFERVLAPEQEPGEVDADHMTPCRAACSPTLQGFFLVPRGVEGRNWNTLFNGRVTWRATGTFSVEAGQPDEYFASNHRPEHFRNFARLYSAAETSDALDIADENESA
jgi:pre-mRNA-processing factor 8